MMFKRWWLCVGMALLTGACAGAQLANNTTELAASLGSLTERQIFYNLAQSLRGRNFFPSLVVLSAGLAQTTNTISPSVSLPLGPALVQAAGTTFAAATTSTAGATVTYGAPGLTLGASNVAQQNWQLDPVQDAGQLRRMRALYNFATGAIDENAFKCEYPVQSRALPVKSNGGNLAYRLPCSARLFFANPTFVRGHDCVLCLPDTPQTEGKNGVVTNLSVNPRLVHGFISAQYEAGSYNLKIGSYDGVDFYVCDGCATGRNGKKAFSDLILFVYEALLESNNDAIEDDDGKKDGGGSSRAATQSYPAIGGGKVLRRMAPYQYSIPLR
ncbi:hypothetical protein BH10PSE6_BH10PSE6_11450 [soil metagenome]